MAFCGKNCLAHVLFLKFTSCLARWCVGSAVHKPLCGREEDSGKKRKG